MEDTDSPRATKRRKVSLPARYSDGGDTVTVAPRKTRESALERLKAKRAAQRDAESSPAKGVQQVATPTKPKAGFFKAFTKPRGEVVPEEQAQVIPRRTATASASSPAALKQPKVRSARSSAARDVLSTPTKETKSRLNGGTTAAGTIPFGVQLDDVATQAHQCESREPITSTEGTIYGVQVFRRIAMERCTGKRPIPITNLDEEYMKVDTVISQTILSGESNSMLLIGARGSGKTTMVNQILNNHSIQHGDDFHVVRLNGFIHTDDKIALREIWRQLGREMEPDGEEGAARNYADTLTTLLALLSTPAELGQTQEAGHVTKSVIFILDEFELFASHPRQTLLYNLFDIAQSRKAPIAVLGLTTKIEVAETLEKRVKSRFSHRFVHLSLPKSFSAFIDVCKAALTLNPAQLSKADTAELIDAFRSTKRSKGTPQDSLNSSIAAWNYAVLTMLSSAELDPTLRRVYYTDKSVPAFLTAMLCPLAALGHSDASSADLTAALVHSLLSMSHLTPPDTKLSLLYTLSTLQLALLVCAARQTAIHSTELVSFNLVYEEYKVLASKAKLQAAASGAMGGAAKVWGREVARDAWRSLLDAGLIMAEGGDGSGRADVGLEEIGDSGVELGGWGRWCKEI